MRDCCLKFRSGCGQLADRLGRKPQGRMSQYGRDRNSRRSSKGGAAFGILQGSVVFTTAPVEHAKRSQQPYLLEYITAILGDGETSPQGQARRLTSAAREDQRDA